MLKKKCYIYNLLISILIILLSEKSKSSYITIPFKIYKGEEPTTYNSIEDYFTYQTELKYYGKISIGDEESPIPIFFSFDDFGFYFITKGTDLGDVNSNYDPTSSQSCKIDKKGYVFFRTYQNATKANDTFIFNTHSNNPLKCKLIKFLYCFIDNKKKNSFLMIGLRLLGDLIRDSDLNLVQQLKHNKYIDTYDWSIQYDEKHPGEEGVLIIGTEPHKYKPEKYNENYYFNSVTMSKESYGIWNIKFDKIYFLNNEEEELEITDYKKFSLVHKSGLIAGTKSYEKLLKQYFFDAFISQNKCFMEKSKLDSRVYYCKNTEEIKKELKKKFPPLKMLQKAFMKTFELNYDDLFMEKGDKIYFLIYFSYYQLSMWEAGLPFLKKYFFNYNYDTKLISFYNNELENMEKNMESKGNNKMKLFIVIGLTLIVTLFGFYIGRKIVLMRRKQKLTATELENDFSKHISGSEYKPPSNGKENSKYRLI